MLHFSIFFLFCYFLPITSAGKVATWITTRIMIKKNSIFARWRPTFASKLPSKAHARTVLVLILWAISTLTLCLSYVRDVRPNGIIRLIFENLMLHVKMYYILVVKFKSI
jgi:hypothetical protein